MENKLNEILLELQQMKSLLKNNEDKLMTAGDVAREFKLGKATVTAIFKDERLPVQRYTKPQKVLRSELLKYFSMPHQF